MSSSLIGVLVASSSAMSLDTNTSCPPDEPAQERTAMRGHEPRSHPVIKVPDLA